MRILAHDPSGSMVREALLMLFGLIAVCTVAAFLIVWFMRRLWRGWSQDRGYEATKRKDDDVSEEGRMKNGER
jgi:hypothetical protein